MLIWLAIESLLGTKYVVTVAVRSSSNGDGERTDVACWCKQPFNSA